MLHICLIEFLYIVFYVFKTLVTEEVFRFCQTIKGGQEGPKAPNLKGLYRLFRGQTLWTKIYWNFGGDWNYF